MYDHLKSLFDRAAFASEHLRAMRMRDYLATQRKQAAKNLAEALKQLDLINRRPIRKGVK